MNTQKAKITSIQLADGEEQPTSIISGVTLNPHLKEGDKYFVFNQTGNIMVSTTKAVDDGIDDETRRVFSEVCVFFAAMTKSITSTPNPDDNGKPYSIYNMEVLEKVIAGSGCFVEMTKELVQYETSSFGMEFSSTLLSSLIGLPGGGALAFANSLLAGVAKEGCRLAGSKETSSSRVGSILFVCEMLMGMPLVSVITLSVDASSVKKVFEASPCLKTESVHSEMKVAKETYLFVTPTFIRQYSDDLDSIIGNAEYGEFISYLQSLIKGSAFISELVDNDGKTTSSLVQGKSYTIKGSGFGTSTENELLLDGKIIAGTATWNDQVIGFTVPTDAATGTCALTIRNKSAEKTIASVNVSVVAAE